MPTRRYLKQAHPLAITARTPITLPEAAGKPREDQVGIAVFRPPLAAEPAIRVGAIVTFEIGGSTMTGIVVRDNGPLGPGGVHLFRVYERTGGEIEPFECDVRGDRLRVVEDSDRS